MSGAPTVIAALERSMVGRQSCTAAAPLLVAAASLSAAHMSSALAVSCAYAVVSPSGGRRIGILSCREGAEQSFAAACGESNEG